MRTVKAFAAQAMHYDYNMAPDTYVPLKRLFAAVALDGLLDRDRLERAVREIVNTHESLRTCPVKVDGEVVQQIRELKEIDEPVLVTIDWDGTGAAISRLKHDLDDWWANPRQLAIRAVLASAPHGKAYLLCAFNGACLDGTSAHLVLEQIRACYGGRSAPNSPVQFTDYYNEKIELGLAETYDDWLRFIDRAVPALSAEMSTQRELTARARIKIAPFDLQPKELSVIDTLRRTYSCTRFEALAVSTELFFRRDDAGPVGVGITHSGRRGRQALEVAGLLRSQVIDLVESHANLTAGDAFRAQLEGLRTKLHHLARLPMEEVCARAGLPGGLRVGEQRLWEVAIVSRISRFPTGNFGEALIESVDAPMRNDWYCENGGSTLRFNYSIQRTQVTGSLQYVNPPVDDARAAAVIEGVQRMITFIGADSFARIGSAPALHRLVS